MAHFAKIIQFLELCEFLLTGVPRTLGHSLSGSNEHFHSRAGYFKPLNIEIKSGAKEVAEQAHGAPHDPTRLRSSRRQNWKTEKVLSPSDAAEMSDVLLKRLALDADMESERVAPPDYPFTTDSDAVEVVNEG